MEGRDKPHADKYQEIISYWKFDTSCMHTSVMVLELEGAG
jgi:hypothetical protein